VAEQGEEDYPLENAGHAGAACRDERGRHACVMCCVGTPGRRSLLCRQLAGLSSGRGAVDGCTSFAPGSGGMPTYEDSPIRAARRSHVSLKVAPWSLEAFPLLPQVRRPPTNAFDTPYALLSGSDAWQGWSPHTLDGLLSLAETLARFVLCCS
jgi:hypothetical protein